MSRAAVAQLAALLLSACAHSAPVAPPAEVAPEPRPEPPVVRFEDVEINRPGFDGVTFVFSWQVENPGPAEVTLTDWQPAVMFHGSPLQLRETSREVTVPPRSKLTVKATASAVYAQLGLDPMPYVVDVLGSVSAMAGERELSIQHPLRHVMPVMPKLDLDGLHVDRRADSFDVTFYVRIENGNRFAVKLDQLRADVRVAAEPICSVALAQPAETGGEASKSVPFLCTVRKSALGALARAALSSTEAVSIDMNGSGTVAGREIPLSVGRMVWPR